MALTQISERTVRGHLWLNQDADGIRHPWNTPLAGIEVTLDGIETVISDSRGYFEFIDIEPGTYSVTTNLPAALQISLGPVVVEDNRGAVIGLPVTLQDRIFEDRFQTP